MPRLAAARVAADFDLKIDRLFSVANEFTSSLA